eukprot:g2654.t1
MKLVIVAAAFAQLAASAATPPRIKLIGADMKHCLIQKTGDAVHSPNCDFSNGVHSLNSNAIAISENGVQIKAINTRLEALESVIIKQTTELNLLRALNDKQHEFVMARIDTNDAADSADRQALADAKAAYEKADDDLQKAITAVSKMQGPKGEQGAPGARGYTGAKGEAGANGAKGDNGAKGEVGSQGATGATGATGAKGATGATGAKGQKGQTGATPTTTTKAPPAYTGWHGEKAKIAATSYGGGWTPFWWHDGNKMSTSDVLESAYGTCAARARPIAPALIADHGSAAANVHAPWARLGQGWRLVA